MKLNWNFWGVGRGSKKKSFCGGGMDIFWNNTLDRCKLIMDTIVFIHGETLSAHSACPRKIPGSIAVVREIVSVN